MKLGNYKWMVCEKCGKRYVQVPGGKSHKCNTSFLKRFLERHRKAKEQHMNDIFNAGEDDRGNPIF